MLGYKNNSVFLLFLFNPCIQGDSGWKFYLHHPLEVPTLGVQTHGTSLYPGQGRDLRLDLKKVSEIKQVSLPDYSVRVPRETNLNFFPGGLGKDE